MTGSGCGSRVVVVVVVVASSSSSSSCIVVFVVALYGLLVLAEVCGLRREGRGWGSGVVAAALSE